MLRDCGLFWVFQDTTGQGNVWHVNRDETRVYRSRAWQHLGLNWLLRVEDLRDDPLWLLVRYDGDLASYRELCEEGRATLQIPNGQAELLSENAAAAWLRANGRHYPTGRRYGQWMRRHELVEQLGGGFDLLDEQVIHLPDCPTLLAESLVRSGERLLIAVRHLLETAPTVSDFLHGSEVTPMLANRWCQERHLRTPFPPITVAEASRTALVLGKYESGQLTQGQCDAMQHLCLTYPKRMHAGIGKQAAHARHLSDIVRCDAWMQLPRQAQRVLSRPTSATEQHDGVSLRGWGLVWPMLRR